MKVVCNNCGKNLGDFEIVKGVMICKRCKTVNKLNIVTQGAIKGEYGQNERRTKIIQ
jgi:phage FluMu protein Com